MKIPAIRNIRKVLPPLVAVVFFVLAIFLLRRLLNQYHADEIRSAFQAIASQRILFSLGLTASSYFFLTLYDTLAFQYIGNAPAYRKIAPASFVSYTFANNTGSLSILASSTIRYRFYSGWGFSALEIAGIIWFCMVSFWLGFLFLAGISFLAFPPGHIFSLPIDNKIVLAAVGTFFLFLVGSYLTASYLQKKPVKLLKWNLALPSFFLAICQVAVAVMDFLSVAGALYVLLPEISLPFGSFVSLFLLAMLLGLVSNVPGGLGVFEGVMLLMLTPYASGAHIISGLLLFRFIYYLLPLGLGIVILGILEFRNRRAEIARMSIALQKTLSLMIPQVLALGVFFSGGILLFSGTMPRLYDRISWLIGMLPLPVLEISHFMGSVAGMGLLILSSGLRRRLDMAYFLTLMLLALGIVSSLLKGLDYEEALWLAIILAVLAASRKQFYRKASIFTEPIKPSWIGALIIVLCGSVGLGLFVYRHQAYSQELWWQFAMHGDAPRFMRASVGAAAVICFFALARLFRAYQPSSTAPIPEELDLAAAIAADSTDTHAYLALLGDKNILFSDSRQSFIMYGIKGRSWIAMGDPIGKTHEATELIWKFKNEAERFGSWPIFYEVGKDYLPLYIDIGMTVLKIGEEGRVNLAQFDLAGSRHKGLRYIQNRLRRDGYQFDVILSEEVPGILGELKTVSDEWLRDKKSGEKGFSLGFFNEAYLRCFPVATVRFQDRILAFANLWPGQDNSELSIDLMRYHRDAPHGIMDFIFIEIMLWGKDQGYRWFSLGMVPLAGLEPEKVASLWGNIGTFIYRHGEHFYNFKGLRNYKDKFDPVWEAKYLVSPGGLHLPVIFANLTSLIGGGLVRVIAK